MEENKKLSRQTNVILVSDVLIALWDMGLATYNFIKGRWILGVVLVAVVVLLLWTAARLLETKHDTDRMRMRHEHMMKFLEVMRSRTEVSDEG